MNGRFSVARALDARVARCVVVGGLVALVSAGCAGMFGLAADSPAETKTSAVSERVYARWDTLIKGDLDSSYAFLSPASKAAFSLVAYKNRMKPPQWKSVKVEAVECEAEVCRVRMRITYDMSLARGIQMRNIESLASETWIIERGTAWFVEPN